MSDLFDAETDVEVLTEKTNAYVIVGSQGVKTVSKANPANQLVYGHGMGDLIIDREGDWSMGNVTIEPVADSFLLRVGDGESLRLNPERVPDLLDVLVDVLDQSEAERTAEPLREFYHDTRDGMVREYVVKAFVPVLMEMYETPDIVSIEQGGWRLGTPQDLRLNWDCEMYYPEKQARSRRGNVIGDGMTEKAYETSGIDVSDIDRDLTIDGQCYQLTDSEAEFVAKAIWAAWFESK